MIFEDIEIKGISKGNDLDFYKELILKRDNLKKEEQYIYIEYVKTFGKLIEKRFALQIECIKNKKIIAICQTKTNRREVIPPLALIESDIDKELEDYYQELQMISEISREESREISEYEILLIKKKYKSIAMSIHPDLHSEFDFGDELLGIWEKAKTAYKCNDLNALEEAEVLLAEYLKKHGKNIDVDIQNIEAKVRKLQTEIDMIISNDPYKYKFLLSDNSLIERKKEELKEDIEEYQRYLEELLDKLNAFEFERELLN